MEVIKFVEMGELLDYYGGLLTVKQNRIMLEYYHDNLSLTEIAENLSVSRQAVHDTIKKSTALLRSFEEELHLVQSERRRQQQIHRIQSLLNRVLDRTDNEESKEWILEALKRSEEL